VPGTALVVVLVVALALVLVVVLAPASVVALVPVLALAPVPGSLTEQPLQPPKPELVIA